MSLGVLRLYGRKRACVLMLQLGPAACTPKVVLLTLRHACWPGLANTSARKNKQRRGPNAHGCFSKRREHDTRSVKMRTSSCASSKEACSWALILHQTFTKQKLLPHRTRHLDGCAPAPVPVPRCAHSGPGWQAGLPELLRHPRSSPVVGHHLAGGPETWTHGCFRSQSQNGYPKKKRFRSFCVY